MLAQGNLTAAGKVSTRVIRGNAKPVVKTAPLMWKLRNYTRPSFLKGYASNWAAKKFSALTGRPTMTAELYAKLIKADGTVIDYGLLSPNVVTTAFVEFMVDQLQTETATWGDFKYHDSGETATAEAIGDTDMGTTDGEARATGTQTEGASANIYRSVGTITYTTTKAIVEHGLFNNTTGATLMDRSVFAVINVGASDAIEFTYELTVNSGG